MLKLKIKDPCWMLLSLNHIILIGVYGILSLFDFHEKWDVYGWLGEETKQMTVFLMLILFLSTGILVSTVFAVMRICQRNASMVGRIATVSVMLMSVGGIILYRDMMSGFETYTYSTGVVVFYVVLNAILSIMMLGEWAFLWIDQKMTKE